MTRNGILIIAIAAGSVTLAAINPMLQPSLWHSAYHQFITHEHEDVQPLITFNTDSTPSAQRDLAVSKAAVYALSNSVEAGNLDELSALLSHPLDGEVKKALVYQIGNHGGEQAVGILSTVITSDSDTEIRKAAIYALGNIGGDEARAVLAKLVTDGLE